jgi:hypothetical protein
MTSMFLHSMSFIRRIDSLPPPFRNVWISNPFLSWAEALGCHPCWLPCVANELRPGLSVIEAFVPHLNQSRGPVLGSRTLRTWTAPRFSDYSDQGSTASYYKNINNWYIRTTDSAEYGGIHL